MAEKKLMVVVGANTSDFVKKMDETTKTFKQASAMAKTQTQILNKETEIWKATNAKAEGSLKTLAKQAQASAEKQAILTAAIRKGKEEYDRVVAAQGETSKTAMTLKNDILSLEVQVSKLNAELDTGKKQLQQFGENAKKVGEKLTSAGKAMTTYVTAPIVAVGTLAVKSAADLQESRSRMATILGNLAGDGQKFASNFSTTFGISQKAIVDNLAVLTLMGQNYGMSKDAAYALSKAMTQVTADVAAFNNMGFAETSERLAAALRGEGEAAEILGLSINQTTLAEFARQKGIKESIQKMDQASLVALRYQMMLDQTAQMAGFAASEHGNLAQRIERMKQSVINALVPLGEALIPIIIDLAGRVQKAAEWFNGLDEKTKLAAGKMAIFAAVIGPIVAVVGSIVTSVGLLAVAMGGLGPAAAGAGVAVGAGFSAMLGPIGIVAGAITGVIALLKVMDKNNISAKIPDGMRDNPYALSRAASAWGPARENRDNIRIQNPKVPTADQENPFNIDEWLKNIKFDAGGAGGSGGGGGGKSAGPQKSVAETIMENLGLATQKAGAIADTARLKFENFKLSLGKNATEAQIYKANMTSLTTQLNAQTDVIAATELALQKMTKEKGAASVEALNLKNNLEQERNEYLLLKEAVDGVTNSMKAQNDYVNGLASKDKQKVRDTAAAMALDALAGGYWDTSKGYGDKAVWKSGKNWSNINSSNIPKFDTGGTVPGPIGSPKLIMAHGGETVLPTHKRPAGPSQVTINIYDATDPEKVGRVVESKFRKLALGGAY